MPQKKLSQSATCLKPCLIDVVSLAEGKKIKLHGQGWTSDRTVRCLTNVEAFSLRAKDIEEVTTLFARFLRSPRVQGVIRSFNYSSIPFPLCLCQYFNMSSPFYDSTAFRCCVWVGLNSTLQIRLIRLGTPITNKHILRPYLFFKWDLDFSQYARIYCTWCMNINDGWFKSIGSLIP